MTKNYPALPVLALGAALLAPAQTVPVPTKVGIMHIQNAIISTKDGQKAATELQAKVGLKRTELEKRQNALAQLQDQLRKGSGTMSDEARQKLMREIDQTNTAIKRQTEDVQAEVDRDQNKIMQQVGQRMMALIDKYAKDNGYSLILDVSSAQTPVLYAANSIDITQDIIGLYDKNAAPAGAPPPADGTPAAPPVKK